ncbi:PepSY-associated TM helix domain-containing protein [Silvibacterium acidisoli]|uniref:PepSY-associated TM helix domain-containing protein n=1 Tax=Acidobacteriaceae bacterium ZG23-2 TaxID=2883246 RepID=UPI00406BF4EB
MPSVAAQPERGARRSLRQRLLNNPQQVWLRKAFFQVHLWAGILVGLYIIAIGVSGSILVFKEELLPRPHVAVPALNLRGCTPEQLAQNIDLVNHAYPADRVYLANCPDEGNPLFAISTREPMKSRPAVRRKPVDPANVYVHPVSNQIVGNADVDGSWLHWVEDFHIYLLAGRSGEQWNGAGAAALLILALSGSVLWWPGIKRWRQSLTVDFKRSWKRINWDLHSAIGIWTVLFTITWAASGVYFAWPKAFTAGIESISRTVTAKYPAQQLVSLGETIKPDTTGFDLLTVLHDAQQRSPQGALEGCFYGSGPTPMFTVYMARGHMGDFANTDFIYYDQNTGRHLLTWNRGQNQTLGDWLLWLAVPLHFGTSWGLGVKIAWAILGLVLPALTVTGFIMYWNRYLGKKMRRA